MKIHSCRDYQDMSRAAAARVIDPIALRKDSLLCAPTGHSPSGLYQQLVDKSRREPDFFRSVRIVKLDEWFGVAADDPGTCEYYLRTRLLDPLNIAPERYIAFNSVAADPGKECERIQRELQRHGAVDICLLGLGKNGHVGFNEPGPSLHPLCHVATLSQQTLRHPMIEARRTKPEYGLTLGMRDILNARKIILLITGQGKERVITEFLNGEVTTSLPATFLLLHSDVEVFIDKSSRSGS
jgi:galactosamine-6-phosphate isomerase